MLLVRDDIEIVKQEVGHAGQIGVGWDQPQMETLIHHASFL